MQELQITLEQIKEEYLPHDASTNRSGHCDLSTTKESNFGNMCDLSSTKDGFNMSVNQSREIDYNLVDDCHSSGTDDNMNTQFTSTSR